jgi:DnaJ-class molecular chaperone
MKVLLLICCFLLVGCATTGITENQLDDGTQICPHCEGKGEVTHERVCPNCNGAGEVVYNTQWGTAIATCEICRGNRMVEISRGMCPVCKGLGVVEKTESPDP